MNQRYIDFVPSKKGAEKVAGNAKPAGAMDMVRVARPDRVGAGGRVSAASRTSNRGASGVVSRGASTRTVSDDASDGAIAIRRTTPSSRPAAEKPASSEIKIKVTNKQPEVKVARNTKPARRPMMAAKPAAKKPMFMRGIGARQAARGVSRDIPRAVPEEKPSTRDWSEEDFLDDLELDELFSEHDAEMAEREAAMVAEPRRGSKYGVIKDLRPRFVKTEVPKRPLSGKVKPTPEPELDVESEAEIATAKSKKISSRAPFAFRKKETAEAAPKPKRPVKKTPFVNTEKVMKRPLSKNVYTPKQVAMYEEEPSGPVTIIQRPEKDSRIGLVVAIIITIILGATAGTVAFLLLPK